MPSDSQFAIAMQNQKEAERAEQQRIKNLVLNYDLQDSSADQAGTGSSSNYDPFSAPNPNYSLRGRRKITSPMDSPKGRGQSAHNIKLQGTSGEKHQHNASLHANPPNHHSSTRPTDKSSSNRSGQRARKLQLSDVDW